MMDFQLLIVIALVVLSAAYLAYRMFGSLGANPKSPAGCAGCSVMSSCAIRKSGPAEKADTPPDCPADNGFVA